MTKFTYNGQEIIFDRVYQFYLADNGTLAYSEEVFDKTKKTIGHSYAKFLVAKGEWELVKGAEAVGQISRKFLLEEGGEVFYSTDIYMVKRLLDLTGGKLPLELYKAEHKRMHGED